MSRASRTAAGLVWVAIFLASGGFPADAQSGRGSMAGWVSFEDVGRNQVKERGIVARVELIPVGTGREAAPIVAETDEIGAYAIHMVPAGEYEVRISSPGYRTYATTVYIPSDFECRLATLLRRA